MGLRNYQIESLHAVKDARHRNVRHALLVYPTGGGKTLAMAHLPQYMGMQPGDKMIVLVHRDELVHQTVEKLQKYNGHLTTTVEKAEMTADLNADLIVASVQTIGRNPLKDGKYEFTDRIKKFDPNRVRFVCVDEAHHALGHSYRSVLAYFGCLKGTEYDREGQFLLGVTATPNRGDNLGLEDVFDEIVYSKPLLEMIHEGWLTDLKAYRVDTSVDLSEVKLNAGDFAIKQLEKTVNTPSRNKLVVDKYIELGEDQRAIAFTVDVQHSEDLAKAFNDTGVRAYAISGKMPLNDRRKVLQLFRNGFYRVLTSCGVLNEGFDDPAVCVGLMARPTKSGLLYRQQVGRVLRPSPAPEEIEAMRTVGQEPSWIKPHAIVIDFCDVSGRHALHTAPTLFGMNAKASLKGKKAGETATEMEKIISQKKLPLSLDQVESLEKLKAVAERVDLLKPPSVPHHVRAMSQFSWVEYAKDSYSLVLPDYGIIRVSQNMLGQWEVARSNKGVKTVLGQERELKDAIHRADKEVPPEARILLNGTSGWRNQPVTPEQINYMWRIDHRGRRQFGSMDMYRMAVKKQYPTKGMASDRINQLKGA